MGMDLLHQFLDRLPKDYQDLLAHRLQNPDWVSLLKNLQQRELMARDALPESVYPSFDHVFRALHLTPLKDLKAVLLGQDPYHTKGLAQGLAFSIPSHIRQGSAAFPSSLRNIHKALVIEGFPGLLNGDLSRWATQGVLLLNASLSVQEGQANSHVGWGWNRFTDALIEDIFQTKKYLVAMLWGGYAQKKTPLMCSQNHPLLLFSSHPSGLGVYKTQTPFLYPHDLGSCGHFKKANAWLTQHGMPPIQW